ncbi:hypothetical protein HUT11_35435 (plasmid) [Streptomyces seoulensis]|nr:hypothetical protein HUT11_35435 [Streptomyces seoulensis]
MPDTTDPLSPEREAEIAAAVAAYAAHPDLGFACCSAHPVADAVPALLAELAAVRAEITTEIARFGIYGSAPVATKALVARADELVNEKAALRAELAAVRAERDQALEDLTGVNLARWEEEQDNARLRLALKSAQRGRRKARARVADPEKATAELDTMPAWLYQRFSKARLLDMPTWDNLDDDSRTYWEHQARAVRRAVARGGFKQDGGEVR